MLWKAKEGTMSFGVMQLEAKKFGYRDVLLQGTKAGGGHALRHHAWEV